MAVLDLFTFRRFVDGHNREVVTRKSRVAIALASLAIAIAIGVSLGAAVEPDGVGRTWTILALLVIPSTGALWYLGRRREPPRPWLFLWIVTLAIGLGGLISSMRLGPGPDQQSIDYGQAGLFLLISTQAASSLWAAAGLKRSTRR